MSASNKERKFYLRAPGLEYCLNGPIKIGNVITDLTRPQDPITFLDPLPKIIPGAGFGEGSTEQGHHASGKIGFAAKLQSIFSAQVDGSSSSSDKTVYEFQHIAAQYLEKNPTLRDVKSFWEKDEEFRNALKQGDVYIITGLKIATGLKYSKQKASEHNASIKGGGRVAEGAVIEGTLEGGSGGEQSDTWTVLGDVILAYRLHRVKNKWSIMRKKNLVAESYDPGEAGFMNKGDEADEFEGEFAEVRPDDVDEFAQEQYWELDYTELEDEEEEWKMAVLK